MRGFATNTGSSVVERTANSANSEKLIENKHLYHFRAVSSQFRPRRVEGSTVGGFAPGIWTYDGLHWA